MCRDIRTGSGGVVQSRLMVLELFLSKPQAFFYQLSILHKPLNPTVLHPI